MIEREVTPQLRRWFNKYPVLTITGPRQSGKTTLARQAFPHLRYVDLEAPDEQEAATVDPRGFLARYPDGVILDEIQHVPELASYIKVLVDADRRNGRFVLTGSEQFGLTKTISQSLVGRSALFRLWPFTLAERRLAGAAGGIDDILHSGFMPRLHDEGLHPPRFFEEYYREYVERDILRLGRISNVRAFRNVVRLLAGRVGQPVNLSSLSRDTGVAHTTISEWLGVLEACDIIFRLEPYYANIRKRITKSPKLYFVEVGLASHLVRIKEPEDLWSSPYRGQLFENAAVIEAVKHCHNRDLLPDFYFLRTGAGFECDLLYERGDGLVVIEIKAGATLNRAWFDRLARAAQTIPGVVETALVYGGAERIERSGVPAVPIDRLSELLEALTTRPEQTPPGQPAVHHTRNGESHGEAAE
ncbi:MAG: ATP-binding protein [Acidimicrobiia bacterium]|nr:ATP-binding protein [Acidimicrobiia bacterium]MYE67467.1 ATP-binding protein [Acidimicrobiia bacterium]MYJ14896.1 ATP-binding protein [Acidimicrobiia bacterium]